jgi:hypothetical protein
MRIQRKRTARTLGWAALALLSAVVTLIGLAYAEPVSTLLGWTGFFYGAVRAATSRGAIRLVHTPRNR